MAEDTVFHIDTLDTLGILVPETSLLKSGQYLTVAIADHILPNLRHLSVGLRLTLPTFKAMATDFTGSGSSSIDALKHHMDGTTFWHSTIKEIEKTIDMAWPRSDEHMVMGWRAGRFISSSDAQRKSRVRYHHQPPKATSKFENRDQHFTKASLPIGVTIHRRYRQREHCREGVAGVCFARHPPDFPVMYELVWFEASHENDPILEGLERWEREVWENGGDPREGMISYDIGHGQTRIDRLLGNDIAYRFANYVVGNAADPLKWCMECVDKYSRL